MIPYGRQEITEDDVNAVVAALRSDFLTQGPQVPLFERVVADRVGAKHAVAVNSATSALHIACLALGVGPGDFLWTSPVTFVASANCGLYCGARVDFVDIDCRTYNICPKALEEKLLKASKVGALPKVLVAVHLAGQSCEMQAIFDLGRKYGFKIIEDASHAIGGQYIGHPIGECRFSDITVFSFHPVKIITTAEGGMALTNSDELADNMALLRSHGITRDPSKMTRASDGPWYYQQIDVGFNYRMTELQAALGLSQLNRIDHYVSRRLELAKRYDQLLVGLPVTIPWRHPDCLSAFHLYIVRLRVDETPLTHRQAFVEIRERGIGINLHYIPVHLQPVYERMGFKENDFPEAERYYQEAISLPMYPTLSDHQQDEVVSCLKAVFGA
jgi:UDP-4-amino-4,6-dideoxy-N-acetyl-beta-L-altrosamine transaminase